VLRSGQGAVANGGAAIGGLNYSTLTDVFKAGNLQSTQTCARDVTNQIAAPSRATATGEQRRKRLLSGLRFEERKDFDHRSGGH